MLPVMQNPQPSRNLTGCLWIFGILVAVVIIISLLSKALPDHGDAYSAQMSCEKFAKDRLLSPSSAKFSPDAETKAVSLSDERWTITGYVDSQNVYGAMLRNRYTCTVKYLGEDKWHLV
jgi:hypothetical protein